jgi:large subunit ribosomal protein L32
MPVPKRKLSRRRRDMRSANKHIIPKPLSVCKTAGCGQYILGHRVCPKCGFYGSVCVSKISNQIVTRAK